jgi:hypothetical protein
MNDMDQFTQVPQRLDAKSTARPFIGLKGISKGKKMRCATTSRPGPGTPHTPLFP